MKKIVHPYVKIELKAIVYNNVIVHVHNVMSTLMTDGCKTDLH